MWEGFGRGVFLLGGGRGCLRAAHGYRETNIQQTHIFCLVSTNESIVDTQGAPCSVGQVKLKLTI